VEEKETERGVCCFVAPGHQSQTKSPLLAPPMTSANKANGSIMGQVDVWTPPPKKKQKKKVAAKPKS